MSNLNQNNNGSTGSFEFNETPVTVLYFNQTGEIVNKLIKPLTPSSEIINGSNTVTYNYVFSNSLTLIEQFFEIHLYCNSQNGTIIKVTDISINNENLLFSSSLTFVSNNNNLSGLSFNKLIDKDLPKNPAAPVINIFFCICYYLLRQIKMGIIYRSSYFIIVLVINYFAWCPRSSL